MDKNSAAAGEGFRAPGALLAGDHKGDLIGGPALDKHSLTVGVPVGKFHGGVGRKKGFAQPVCIGLQGFASCETDFPHGILGRSVGGNQKIVIPSPDGDGQHDFLAGVKALRHGAAPTGLGLCGCGFRGDIGGLLVGEIPEGPGQGLPKPSEVGGVGGDRQSNHQTGGQHQHPQAAMAALCFVVSFVLGKRNHLFLPLLPGREKTVIDPVHGLIEFLNRHTAIPSCSRRLRREVRIFCRRY